VKEVPSWVARQRRVRETAEHLVIAIWSKSAEAGEAARADERVASKH